MDAKCCCAYDKLVPVADLQPNPRNPYSHPPDQLRLLGKVIEYQGWRHPIVVSNQTGLIVHGHARREAALLMGWAQVPVDFQDYADEAQEYADLIADNQIAELAAPNLPGLKDILGELDTGQFDLELVGMSALRIEDILTTVPERPNNDALVDQFSQNKGGCKEDGNWFYVEFYGDDATFAALKTALGPALLGPHQLDAAWFARAVTALAKAAAK